MKPMKLIRLSMDPSKSKTLSNENSFIDGFNDLALPEAQNGDGEDSDLDELLYGESGRKKKKSRKPKEEDVNVDDFFV